MRAVHSHVGLCRGVQSVQSQAGPCRGIWVRPCEVPEGGGPVGTYMSLCKSVWIHVDLCEPMSVHMGLYKSTWAMCGPILPACGPGEPRVGIAETGSICLPWEMGCITLPLLAPCLGQLSSCSSGVSTVPSVQSHSSSGALVQGCGVSVDSVDP